MSNRVCRTDELEDGAVRLVTIGGKEIGVFRHGDGYYAYRNLCPHQGGPACEGMRLPQVEDVVDATGLFMGQRFNEADTHIVCPWHGYEFHIETGVHVADAKVRLQRFDVTVEEGDVIVHV